MQNSMISPMELEMLYAILNPKPDVTLDQIIDNFVKDFSTEI